MAIGIPAMVSADQSGDVNINATVGNAPPYVCCKWEEPDDDLGTPGIQIMPNQNANKTVTIVACVCDPNGNDDIESVSATVTGPGGFNKGVVLTRDAPRDGDCAAQSDCNCTPAPDIDCVAYTGTFDMGPCDDAGTYTVSVTAYDGTNYSDPLENTFEYLSMMGIELDRTSVAFPPMSSGDHVWVTGDDVWGGNKLTVHSTNNLPIDIQVTAPGGLTCQDPAQCDAAVIPEGNLDCTISGVGPQWLPSCHDVNLACCQLDNVDLSILAQGSGGIPLPAGPYSGTVTFTAVASCP